ncbi:MAG: hypothetical protein ACRD0K_06150 [Egibacteraceae bacterium]
MALLSLLGSPRSAPAQAQEGATSASPTTVASCLASRQHLLVLALIDESGSLVDTDPGARRVDGLGLALRTLARFGDRDEVGSDAPTIEVMLAGFADGFRRHSSWTVLNEDTLPGVEAGSEEFRGRTVGLTDFVAALQGAQTVLAQRASEVEQDSGQPPCRLLLFFTDGGYDLDNDPSARSEEETRGVAQMCDPGGTADQLRAAETTIVAVALIPTQAPFDQTLLREIAEGGCGRRREPPGTYLPTDGLDQLLGAFDCAIAEALGGTGTSPCGEGPTCAQVADRAGARTFELDESLREFHVLLHVGAREIEVQITSPAADQPHRVTPGQSGSFALGTAMLDVESAGDLDLVIDGVLPPGTDDWVGRWTITFVDPDGRHSETIACSYITVFGGLAPRVEPLPTLRVGERADFEIKVVDAEGSPRTPQEFVQAARVTATVTDPEGNVEALVVEGATSGGPYRTSYTVPDGTTAPYVHLAVTLEVTTRDGLRLKPSTQTYRIPVQPPSDYPMIEPPDLRLSPIVGQREGVGPGVATGTITITGGESGGCVWFEPPVIIDMPEGVGNVSVSLQPQAGDLPTCVRVGPGEAHEVRVVARPDVVRPGLVRGRIPVRLIASDDPGTVRELDLPLSFEMVLKIDPEKRLWLLILLMVAGVGLPVAALWLVNSSTARFERPGLLLVARIPVTVTDAGVQTDESPKAGAMPQTVSRDTSPRQFMVDDLTFRAHVPPWPVQPPYATVNASHGQAYTSKTRERGDGALVSEVSFQLPGTWVFVEPAEAPGPSEGRTVSGTLYLFIGEGDDNETARSLLEKTKQELPQILNIRKPRPGE